MKLERITDWLDRTLKVADFDDVSNNGLQIDWAIEQSNNRTITTVALAVDASVKSVRAAAKAGAQLLVVHHGISWGGGIKRISGGVYNVVRAAMDANLSLAGYHLPLDANRKVGNNWELARHFRLRRVRPAFSYHGNVIGVTGVSTGVRTTALGDRTIRQFDGQVIGICSGGAGEFAAEAKALGCDLFVTGEASWGDVIAAENIGMPMLCAGHYETEIFGVKALMRSMRKALGISAVFVSLMLCARTGEAESLPHPEEDLTSCYLGVAGSLLLPQGGSRITHFGGAALRGGYCFSDWFAVEGEASWMEDRAGLAARGIVHWKGWHEWDMLFGFSRWDPFLTIGVGGWLPDGQVGPAAGIGVLYYLDDCWALRIGGEATLGLDSNIEMIYSLAAGVQYGW